MDMANLHLRAFSSLLRLRKLKLNLQSTFNNYSGPYVLYFYVISLPSRIIVTDLHISLHQIHHPLILPELYVLL